jgi:hypothetical protein
VFISDIYSLLNLLRQWLFRVWNFRTSRCPENVQRAFRETLTKVWEFWICCRKYFNRLPSTKIFNSETDPIIINKYTNFYYPHQLKKNTYINILYILSPATCFDPSALSSASFKLVFCILTYLLSYLLTSLLIYLLTY